MGTDAEALTLIAFVILTLVPTIGTFALPSGRRLLGFLSSGTWLILGIYTYQASLATWDVLYIVFWFSMGMVATMALYAAMLRESKEDDIGIGFDNTEIDEDDTPQRERTSSFAKTGITKVTAKRLRKKSSISK